MSQVEPKRYVLDRRSDTQPRNKEESWVEVESTYADSRRSAAAYFRSRMTGTDREWSVCRITQRNAH